MNKTNKLSSNRSFLQRVGDEKGLVAIGIIGVLVIGLIIAQYVKTSDVESAVAEMYSVHIVREEDPILFDGMVKASDVQEAYYDSTG